MSLLSSLNSAVSGLQAQQSGVDVISQNVANAETEGYTRKVQDTRNLVADGEGMGVRAEPVQRMVDERAQSELRQESSRAKGMEVVSDFMSRLDKEFGAPEDERSLASRINELRDGLQALGNNPESGVQREAVLRAAEDAANTLNRTSQTIQDLRSEAESRINDAAERVNEALKNVEEFNKKIVGQGDRESTAALEDKRDREIRKISDELDIRVRKQESGRAVIQTADGKTLLDQGANELVFDERPAATATARFDSDREDSNLGTLRLRTAGGDISLMTGDSLQGGRLSGLVAARDEVLVSAQNRLDELASELAFAMSERNAPVDVETRDGEIVSAEMTVTQFSPGDKVQVDLAGAGGDSAQREIAVVDKDPADTRSGEVSARQDRAAIFDDLVARLESEVGQTGLSVTSDADDGTITITQDDPAQPTKLKGLTGTSQAGVGLDGEPVAGAGDKGFNLFVDGQSDTQQPYLGAAQAADNTSPPQQRGFAARIAVNEDVQEDPSQFVRYPADRVAAESTTSQANAIRQDETGRLTGFTDSDNPDFVKTDFAGNNAAQTDTVTFSVDDKVTAGDSFTVRVSDPNPNNDTDYKITYTAAGSESLADVRDGLINTINGDDRDLPGQLDVDGSIPVPSDNLVRAERGETAGQLKLVAREEGVPFNTDVSAGSRFGGETDSRSQPGDPSRVRALAQRLGEETRQFTDGAGLGSSDSPFEASVTEYANEVVAVQSQESQTFQQRFEDQDTFAQTLQKSFDDKYGVNLDAEMSRLIDIQTSYSANARVVTTVDQMMDEVLAIAR